MLKDSDLKFGPVTANGTATVYSDVFKNPGTKFGNAIMWLVARVTTAFTGDATVIEVTLESSDLEGGTYVSTGLSKTYTDVAQLAANVRALIGAIPPNTQQFMRLKIDPNGTTGLTAGVMEVFLTPELDQAL